MDKKLVKQRKGVLNFEEQIVHSRRARLRFKAAVRFVIENMYWLDDDDQELGEDVQKNVLLLTRKKEKKSLLSMKHVKTQLAGVTYFFYFGPGRTIVRQGHESLGLYFVITGSIIISQEKFDPISNKMVSNNIGVVGPGIMFGEAALLHNLPRTATITSSTHVELLCIKKEDFDVILKSTVQQEWDNIKKAMSCFAYSKGFDEIATRECCILAKLQTFGPNQTILGDGFGHDDCVYFILTGRCQVIEHLLVTSEIRMGKKHYKLYIPQAVDFISSSNTDLLKIKENDENLTSFALGQGETGVKSEKNESNFKFRTNSTSTTTKSKGIKEKFINKYSFMETSGGISTEKSVVGFEKTDIKSSLTTTAAVAATTQQPSTNTPWTSKVYLPPYVETHFIQVCLLNSTACFGIEENMSHRRVVASTNTECLLIPRYWLTQNNRGNIWNKIRQFFNKHVPTTEEVFQEFVKHRKWLAYRRKLVEDIVSKRKKINNNTIHNVPYFIRMNEEIDF